MYYQVKKLGLPLELTCNQYITTLTPRTQELYI